MHNKLPLLLLSLFIFCGCEKDVDLKINENESKLVLNAWFKTGQHPTVEINRSTFIFDRRGTDRIEKAEVLLFADEQQIGRLEHFGSGFYTNKSLEIKEETEYKIIAKLDGFETVTAIEKSSVKLAKKDYSFECTTYLNTLQGYPQSETELTIKDQANSDDFYLFRIKSTSTEYDNDYPEDTTYSENYVYIQSSDLQIEEIYNNSRETKSQVKGLIGELKPLIENIGDATLLVPMIKEYMEIGVKNDEHLIKLATVIQRLEAIQAKGGDGDMFDFSDLQDLLEESEVTQQELENKVETDNTSDEVDNV